MKAGLKNLALVWEFNPGERVRTSSFTIALRINTTRSFSLEKLLNKVNFSVNWSSDLKDKQSVI
jgi:hypothetical protein